MLEVVLVNLFYSICATGYIWTGYKLIRLTMRGLEEDEVSRD